MGEGYGPTDRLIPLTHHRLTSPTSCSDKLSRPLPVGEGAPTETRTRGYTAALALQLDLPVHERHHALEHVASLRQIGRMAGMAVRLDIFERDLAASLAIILDKALRLVAGEA